MDTDVILSYLNKEPNRLSVLKQIFHDIKNDDNLKIITSVLSKDEIFYLMDSGKIQMDSASETKINGFFHDSSIIELVSVNEHIVDISRDFKRELKKNKLKFESPDAIHLATAEWLKVDEFYTYNLQDFNRVSHRVSFPIKEPCLQQLIMPFPKSQPKSKT